jgi:ribonuclease HII
MVAACPPEDLDALLDLLSCDERAGVRALAAVRRRARARERAEYERLVGLMVHQRRLHDLGYAVVAGVDEVGRGALAGPVTAAAVVLDVSCVIRGLDDSKRIPRPRRPEMAAAVRSTARAVCVAHVSAAEIDTLGIAAATRLAWRRAVQGLGAAVDHVLVDGNDERCGYPATAIVGGDSRCACIAAASVVAKVERDALMEALAAQHPRYRFDENRGYGTTAHIEALRLHGPSPVHRRSFAPCAQPELF